MNIVIVAFLIVAASLAFGAVCFVCGVALGIVTSDSDKVMADVDEKFDHEFHAAYRPSLYDEERSLDLW